MSQVLAGTLLPLLLLVSCIYARSISPYEKQQVYDILQDPEGRELVSNELGEVLKSRLFDLVRKLATSELETQERPVDDETQDVVQQLFPHEPIMVRKSPRPSNCIPDFWKGRGRCRTGRSARL
ncbi:uncharacterized protein [Antedon mediterranea]|uniref:uncharacterized protein n=1 Tax=Antedon mediterranea TaxID=105859 RepID=UPI003AF6E9B0